MSPFPPGVCMQRELDFCEMKVKEYLHHCGHTEVLFEPEGPSKPPDFLVDGRFAVEATRLLEHEVVNGNPRSLTQTFLPLQHMVLSIADSIGPPIPSRTWVIHGTVIRRPFTNDKGLRRAVRRWLEDFAERGDCDSDEVVFNHFLRLRLTKRQKPLSKVFGRGIWADGEEGGSVLEMMATNIRICMDQKAKKVAAIRHKYTKWWLALTDSMAIGMSVCEIDILKRQLGPTNDWDQIIIVDPSDIERSFRFCISSL